MKTKFPAFLLLVACLALPALAATFEKQTDTGKQYGTDATQAIGFLGATPIPQLSGTDQLALADSTGGIRPAAVTVTGTNYVTVLTGTVTASGTGSTLHVYGALPGDRITAALSGTTSALSDFTASISGASAIVQSGTSVAKPGTEIVVTIGRHPVSTTIPLVSGTDAASINANFAAMAAAINELRADLVKFGFIKGAP